MKYFRMPYDEIVKKRSYKNIILLNASIPTYNSKKNKKNIKENKKFKGKHPNQFFEQFM